MATRIETLYELWAKRNPKYEQHYESNVVRKLSDYGVGASESTSARGKILGAGYEVYLMAFFIGLYANKATPLTGTTTKLGQPLQYWGNLDSKKNRKAYSEMRDYIFAALVARTDIDFIALDKDLITPAEVVTKLIGTMEEYANYGFNVIADKLGNNENYFYDKTSFLNMFLSLMPQNAEQEYGPESLD
jgi:hypothetical protein